MSDDAMMTWWHPIKGCIQGLEEGGDETWIRVRLAGDHRLHRHGPVDSRIDPDGKILLIRRSRMHTTPLPPIQEGGHATYQGVVHKASSPPAPATPQSAMIPWEGRTACGKRLTCHTATTVMVTCPACLAAARDSTPGPRRQEAGAPLGSRQCGDRGGHAGGEPVVLGGHPGGRGDGSALLPGSLEVM